MIGVKERGQVDDDCRDEFCASRDELPPTSNAEEAVESLKSKLTSDNWEEVCHGLVQIRGFTKLYVSTTGPKLDCLIPLIVGCLSSLRSAVVKAALTCVEDLIFTLKSNIKYFVDGTSSCILLALMERSSFDKKFIKEQAHTVLKLLIATMPPAFAIKAALPLTTHSRPQFRAQVAFTLDFALQMVTKIEV